MTGGVIMKEKIIIFGKEGWPYTEKARSAYGEAAEYFDVKADSEKMEEMLKHSGGVRKVPVILEKGKVTIGFGGAWGVWCRQVAGGSLTLHQAEEAAKIFSPPLRKSYFPDIICFNALAINTPP